MQSRLQKPEMGAAAHLEAVAGTRFSMAMAWSRREQWRWEVAASCMHCEGGAERIC